MKFSRRVVFAAAAVAMMASAGSAMAEIRFGVAAEPYPPFTSKDASGKWVGWEVDLMDAVCAELKEKCSIVEVAWDGIIPALQAKQFDLIWSSMTITDERKQTIDFTNFYYDTPTVLIGAKNGDMDITPEHLKGKVIGAQVSTIHQKYVEAHYVAAGAEIKTYQTQDEVNQDMAAGRIDYDQADGAALDAFLKTDQGKACCELKGQVADDPHILGAGVGAGVRKEDTALRDRINGALAALAKAGKFQEITAKYPDLAPQIVLPKP
ncbi:MAG: transporter substrate-binding domain-containing protein [Rhizobiales bacterium]|nr:transporter substrate-binding domain-containing protein [Hyphomicrobiales bacterium]MBI3674121.1 transporter substrate-binding domain-containing protein [Hyphomicrobiales bacterium]